MNEEFAGFRQPIYRNLWIYWLTMLASLVLTPFDGALASLLGLAASIVGLYQFYVMRSVSEAMAKAFRTMLIGVALTIGSLLLALLALGSALSMLLLLVTLAGAIVILVSDYYFYSALDHLAVERGYEYPAGRIKWCFYLSLIGGIVGNLIGNVGAAQAGAAITVAANIGVLVLLWQYLQAVKQNEQI